jgi:hypothetical protein
LYRFKIGFLPQLLEIQKEAERFQLLLMVKKREDLLKQYQLKQQQQQLSRSKQSSAQASEDDDDIVILDGAPQLEVKKVLRGHSNNI